MSTFNPKEILWEETVPGGNHWSGIMRRGSALRFTDLQGGANVSLLLYNFEEKLERYNMPDSLKAQHTAFFTTGNVCYSDMGRVMCSFIHDTVGWHDTMCGISDTKLIEQKYGVANYQTHRNDMYRSAKDGLLIELAKYGLGQRDLVANVNLFSKVSAKDDGSLVFNAGNSKVGNVVDLRFDMNVIVVLSTAPHPLDTAMTYKPSDMLLTAWHAGQVADDDICRNSCEQNQRGFINTERFYAH